MAENVIEGLILSVIADYGPDPIINLSSLDEVIALKLSIVGITILSMGLLTSDTSETRNYNLLGPIPVPDSSGVAALCMFFNVVPDLGTKDSRVEKFGRECNLWLIFEAINRDRIFKLYSRMENLVNSHLIQFKNESELKNHRSFKELLSSLQTLELTEEYVKPQPIISQKLKLSSEPINYGFYTLDSQDQLIPVRNINNLTDLDCLIQIDLNDKFIYVLKLNPNLSKRQMFFAGRAASQLNMEKLKAEFQVQNISDKFEVDFHLRSIDQFLNKFK